MSSLVESHAADFTKTIEHFKQDIAGLKTGRANPAILDRIAVEAYGAKMPVNQVASITVAEARNILVQPWDRNLIKDLEKALRGSDLNLAIANEGERIRITMPLMTEESRKEIIKVLHQKTEAARIALRNLRDEIKEEILTAEKNKEFGEDERYILMEKLDKTTAGQNEKIKEISEQKEQEILTI